MPISQLQAETARAIGIYTWAAKPPAAGNAGRRISVSDLRNSEFYSDGTYWRPVGGRQVLAQRSNNPVTVQNTAGAVSDLLGPFPGGLVRAGMQLRMDWTTIFMGLGAGSNLRRSKLGFANSTSLNDLFNPRITLSTDTLIMFAHELNVQSDTSANHGGSVNQIGLLSYSDKGTLDGGGFTMDFSQPWYAGLTMVSAAETAVNISSATWAGGIATFNTSAAHTLAVGDKTVIASVTPSGWNIPAGAIVLSVPTSTQFTVAMAANPGAYTSGGTSSRISNVISQSYVLELVG